MKIIKWMALLVIALVVGMQAYLNLYLPHGFCTAELVTATSKISGRSEIFGNPCSVPFWYKDVKDYTNPSGLNDIILEKNGGISGQGKNLKPLIKSFDACISNGGTDITPNFNAPRKCTYDNVIYEDECIGNDKYFVISKYKAHDVGTDIVVRNKTSKDQIIKCDYSVKSGDFAIDGSASYILGLQDNFLLIDSGTGPSPRGITIYDLAIRRMVYNGFYSKPINIKGNILDYWEPTSIAPTNENCPDRDVRDNYGLGAIIEERVSLDMSEMKKVGLGETRCVAKQ